jgi:hypothetical protein
MMASATTIAIVTAMLALSAQSRMTSEIVTAMSAQRAGELRWKAEKEGSALPVSVRVGNGRPSTAAAGYA